jgi:hypothetical protein
MLAAVALPFALLAVAVTELHDLPPDPVDDDASMMNWVHDATDTNVGAVTATVGLTGLAALATFTVVEVAVLQDVTELEHTADTVYVSTTRVTVCNGDAVPLVYGITVAEADKYATNVDVDNCEQLEEEAPPNVNSFEQVNVDVGVGDSEAGESSVIVNCEPELENWAASNFGGGGDVPAASTTKDEIPFL